VRLRITRQVLAEHAKIPAMAPRVRSIIDAEIESDGRGRKTGAGKRAIRMKLENPHLSDSMIARRVGCSPQNVSQVLARFLGDHSQDELREFQENKADIFDALQLRALKSITNEDIAKAPFLPRVTGAAILEDKARTIRGQATQINVSVLLDAVQTIRDLRQNRT
jgi:hypothetical protein